MKVTWPPGTAAEITGAGPTSQKAETADMFNAVVLQVLKAPPAGVKTGHHEVAHMEDSSSSTLAGAHVLSKWQGLVPHGAQ